MALHWHSRLRVSRQGAAPRLHFPARSTPSSYNLSSLPFSGAAIASSRESASPDALSLYKVSDSAWQARGVLAQPLPAENRRRGR